MPTAMKVVKSILKVKAADQIEEPVEPSGNPSAKAKSKAKALTKAPQPKGEDKKVMPMAKLRPRSMPRQKLRPRLWVNLQQQ